MDLFLTFVGYLGTLCAAAIVLAMSIAYVVPDGPSRSVTTEVSAQKTQKSRMLSGQKLTRELAARAARRID